MPLLVLCDPGFCVSVGVSKPAGASTADCCAVPLKPTAHTLTNADVIRRFLEMSVAFDDEGDGVYRVNVGGS